MRQLHLLYIVFFFLACQSSEKPLGKDIKCVTTNSYSVIEGDTGYEKDLLAFREAKYFSTSGQEDSMIVYFFDGSIDYKIYFKYDSTDRQIGANRVDATGKTLIEDNYHYNDEDHIAYYERFEIPSNKILQKTYYTYDSLGRRIEIQVKNAKDRSLAVYQYEYDSLDNEKNMRVYYDSTLISLETYEYISFNHINEWTEKHYYQNDTLNLIKERVYDFYDVND